MALNLAYSAIVAALLSAVVPLLFYNNHKISKYSSFVLLGLSGLSGVLGGGLALLKAIDVTAELPVGLPWLPSHLHLDPLAGFFLVLVSLVTLIISVYGTSYVDEYSRHGQSLLPLLFFTGLFVAGMEMVLIASDAFTFMISWELMSVSSYFLVAYQHQYEKNRSAAFIYLLMAQVGGLFILLSYGVLAGFAGGFDFASMQTVELSPLWASLAFTLALIGFGMKAGVVPLHVWLPQAHPVAPSHISALMSGVMLKVAVYGFIRFVYGLLGAVYWQWGVAVLIIGSLSAILGVLYALMQHDLKRLLAYHSVENIGIIYIGLGLSMIFAATDHLQLAILGLIAALYHSLNHALFKSLLFLGAGAVLQQSGEHDLEKMGGLIKRMPVTAFCFLIGCISISALPPFNGFVSEWLTFQAALQGIVLDGHILTAVITISAALLALTGALAAACFVKVFGVCFLGVPRSETAAQTVEVSRGSQVAQLSIAFLCLCFGVFPTWTVGQLNHIAQLFFPAGLLSATAHGGLWLTPISPKIASYGAPLVFLAIAAAWVIIWLWLHPRRKKTSIRRSPTWDCGFGALNGRMQYTATSFSMPIRRIFKPIWSVDESYSSPDSGEPGGRYRLNVGDWAWLKIYQPIGQLLLATARRAALIQGGNIRVYLVYSFFTLLFLLWVVSL